MDSSSSNHQTGVKVFGSAIVRVSPDIASIVVAVTCLEQEPSAAFARAHEGAKSVQAYLNESGITEFGTSRVSLAQEKQFHNGQQKFVGYRAGISYSIVLRSLDRIDEVITDLVDAGANELTSLTFQTNRLKDVRADARRRAVAAAREKAELYCEAAGVSLGRVIALEDVNPESLTGRWEGHVKQEPVADDTGGLQAIDPAAITVTAAVNMVFEIAAGTNKSPSISRRF